MNNGEKIKTNSFYVTAMDYIESPELIQNKDIATIDRTSMLYAEFDAYLKGHENLNIRVNAPVRKGKSTVAIALGEHLIERMNKLGISGERFKIKNIARTQYELSKKIKDHTLNNTVIVIDEFDDLENTGENSTVEEAFLKQFSKVQAVRYIHRIYCSPSDSPDSESDIILYVVQADKARKTTHCRLYFRVLKGDVWYVQLLGYVDIDVSNVINNWIDNGIEKLFYKKNKTEDELKHIQNCRKKDFYVDYMCRKLEKIDALNKDGIFRTRDLDYSDIILEIIYDLRDLTMATDVTKSDIRNHIRTVCRQHRVPLSMLGEQIMIERIDGVLSSYRLTYKQERKIASLRKKLKELNNDELRFYELEVKAYTKRKQMIAKELEELHFLKDTKKKFYDESGGENNG